MKIYFAGAIRGGREDAALYSQIIELLKGHGEVLTEHVGDPGLSTVEGEGRSDRTIYERNMARLAEADVLIAEVTIPSHGVGYEVARAQALGKPVLCLHRQATERRLSAMLAGNPALRRESYEHIQELDPILERFLS